MVGLSIKVQGAVQLSRNLRLAAREMKDFSGFLDETLDIIASRSDALFSAEGANVEKASPWPPLSPKTIRAREKRWGYYKRTPRNPGILRWTGNLQQTRDRYVSPKSGRLTFTMPYARYHQNGGPNLPKRVIIDLSNPTNAEIVRSLQRHVHEALGIFGRQV